MKTFLPVVGVGMFIVLAVVTDHWGRWLWVAAAVLLALGAIGAAQNEPVETWHVTFEKGGQVYTYRRTQSALAAEMRERHMIRGTWPHKVEVVRNGQVRPVEIGGAA